MFLGYRSNDATLTIAQDNVRRTIMIQEINPIAEETLGFSNGDIAGKPLLFMLPERIGNLLEDYVEFDPNGNDVGAVLSKVQSFCLIAKDRKEVAFRVKILRVPAQAGLEVFKLILQNPNAGRRNEAFRALLRENFKGHEVLDAATKLPDRASIAKDIEFAMFYVQKGELKASVAVLEVMNFYTLARQHGEAETYAAFTHAATLMRRSLRGDDVIGFLAPKRLAVILFDTTPESSRMVLNRLRWVAAADLYLAASGASVPLHLGMCFRQLQTDTNAGRVLPDIEHHLDTNSIKENSIEEV